jgi:glycosyltransferase 2 family protein
MASQAGSGHVMAIRLAGSAIMLALLLLVVPFDDIMAALRRVPPGVWVGALGGYLLAHMVGVCKWLLLINTAGAGLGFLQAVRCYYYGLFGNVFLPSVVGGDVVRAALAMKFARSSHGLLLGSFADRLIDTIGLAAVAGIGALLLPTALDPQSRDVFIGIAVVFVLLGVGGVAALLLLPVVRKLSFKRRRLLIKVRTAFRELSRRPGRVVSAMLLGMLLQVLLIALNVWLGEAVGIRISFVVWLVVWPLAKIAALLPLTQGGIGVREGALVILFQPFGVSAAAAMATGLIFTAVVMTGGLLSGVGAFLLGRRTTVAGSTVAAVRL